MLKFAMAEAIMKSFGSKPSLIAPRGSLQARGYLSLKRPNGEAKKGERDFRDMSVNKKSVAACLFSYFLRLGKRRGCEDVN